MQCLRQRCIKLFEGPVSEEEGLFREDGDQGMHPLGHKVWDEDGWVNSLVGFQTEGCTQTGEAQM